MKRKHLFNATESGPRDLGGFGAVILCLVLLFVSLAGPVVAQEDPLREAAESFLELLDAGSFQQAWWEGSELLHLTSSLDDWVDEVRVRRNLLGKLKERSVRTLVRRESLSGLPDGTYGVLVTESRFEKKRKGSEMLTLGRDLYGSWRVISYRLH